MFLWTLFWLHYHQFIVEWLMQRLGLTESVIPLTSTT